MGTHADDDTTGPGAHERQQAFWLAGLLLAAGLLPVLTPTPSGGLEQSYFEPSPATALFAPRLATFAVYYPVAVAPVLFLLAVAVPRWARGLGFLALGGLVPVLLAQAGGLAAATGGVFGLGDFWDRALPLAFAVVFVAGQALAILETRFPVPSPGGGGLRGAGRTLLAWALALAGLLIAAWLLVPRPLGGCDATFGFVSSTPSSVPLFRGFLRNQDFPEGTNPLEYLWWNLLLLAWVALPVTCFFAGAKAGDRGGRAWESYSILVAVLVAYVIPSLLLIFWEARKVGLAAVADYLNWFKWTVPPLMLAGVALAGLSDLLVAALKPGRAAAEDEADFEAETVTAGRHS